MSYEPTPEDLKEMEIVYAIRDIQQGFRTLFKTIVNGDFKIIVGYFYAKS